MVVIKQAKRRVKEKIKNDPLMELLEALKKSNEIPYALKCHEEIPFSNNFAKNVKSNYLKWGKNVDINSWNEHKEKVIIPYLDEHGQKEIIKELENM